MELEFIHSSFGWIPKCDGKLLHSSVDPVKEAAELIERNWKRLADVKTVIVFGLGGGFHIAELIKRKKTKILIIDCDEVLADQVLSKNPLTLRNATLVVDGDVKKIIANEDFKSATSGSYAVVHHPASCRINQDFYKEVQSHLTHRSVENVLELVEKNKPLHQFIESMNLESEALLNLHQLEQSIFKNGNYFKRESMIWMILRELVV